MLNRNTVVNWITGGVIGGLISLLILLQVDFTPDFHPIEYEDPVTVLNEDKILVLGEDQLELNIKRCNNGDTSVRNVIVISFQGVIPDGNGGFVEIEGLTTASKAFTVRNFIPGCKDQIFEDTLPEDITVGYWKEKGSTTVWDNGNSDVIRWESEVFKVIE